MELGEWQLRCSPVRCSRMGRKHFFINNFAFEGNGAAFSLRHLLFSIQISCWQHTTDLGSLWLHARTMTPIRSLRTRMKEKPVTTSAAPIKRRIKRLRIEDFAKKSKFMRVQRPSAGLAAHTTCLTDDNAPIHAIFARGNWKCSMSEERYEALMPSMRLASRFLTSKQIRPMFHTMLSHGPMQGLGEKDTNGDLKYAYPDADCRPDRVQDAAMIRHIEVTLTDLADFIVFQTHDGGCRTKAGPEGERLCNALHPKGAASTVFLPHNSLDQLVDAHKAFATTQDLPLLIAKRFELAMQLTHEVCHALQNHVAGDLPTEPFFGPNAVLAETGFEAEYRLLGGQFSIVWAANECGPSSWQVHQLSNGQISGLTGIPILWRWPCRGTWREYVSHDSGMWERKRFNRDAPKNDIAWRVMIDDMQRYFTSAFWMEAEKSEKLDFLHIQKKVGYPFHFEADGQSLPATIRDEDLLRQGIVGYTVDESTFDIVMADT